MIARFRTMEAILSQAGRSQLVRKSGLSPGDLLIVATENSVYTIEVEEDGTYEVRGGWFDRRGLSPARLTITGCTWGGSAIKTDVAAACGLQLEFGNRVLTSRIREVHLIRAGASPGLRPACGHELLLAAYGARWKSAWVA
ncbi:MAG TPA: hypothetical protein VIE39_07055 [Thermoanaerobaculia bacterium]